MLIIFDCDGVLVDSEQLAAQVFSEVLDRYGVNLSTEECFQRFKGHTLTACFKILDESCGFEVPPGFLEDINAATQWTFARELRRVEGVEHVIEFALTQGCDICVASNGGYNKLCNSLKAVDLYPYFDGRCFSAEFVERGKPEPDLFLFAAQKMGYEVNNCLVVEDSPQGITAAKQAGIAVVHYTENVEGSTADFAFDSMTTLLHSEFFRNLF